MGVTENVDVVWGITVNPDEIKEVLSYFIKKNTKSISDEPAQKRSSRDAEYEDFLKEVTPEMTYEQFGKWLVEEDDCFDRQVLPAFKAFRCPDDTVSIIFAFWHLHSSSPGSEYGPFYMAPAVSSSYLSKAKKMGLKNIPYIRIIQRVS